MSSPSDRSRPTTDRAHARGEPGRPLASRIAAIDWMRGFVMVLMAVDHASQMWNGGRLNADSAYLPNVDLTGPLWVPGSTLDGAQFATRWITHLCAPTFLFLSGTSLVMSFEKRRGQGLSEGALDRHLLIRAGVVLGCEALLSLLAGVDVWILQVLFAIGTSMIAMVVLRRLPTTLLVALGLGWLAGSELVLSHFFPVPPDASGFTVNAFSTAALMLFVPGFGDSIYVLYPMTHWLAMMVLGWAFGRFVLAQPPTQDGRQQIEKLLLLSGLSSLLFWAFVRRQNGYGNMGLLWDDATLAQWLHVSKYPPALSYSLMELGLMALFLVLFLRHERVMQGPPKDLGPLLVFGQTALFFYMLHFILLGASALAFGGGMQQGGLRETWIAAGAVLVVLYPICLGFRALKRRYPQSVLQYI